MTATSCTPRPVTTAPASSSSRSASPSPSCPRRRASSTRRTTSRRARRPAYAGKRLFIIGKQNSGFELASGLLQWASPIILASPRPAQLSVNLHSLGGVRARYIQPWEDAALGGGVFILDAAIERIERRATGLAVHTRRSDTSEPFVAEVDEVIAATGFRAPLLDLEDVGVSLFGRSGLPAMTNAYESTSAPGIYFAGTIGQAVGGLQKYGIPANSGAVHGHRYNARLLVDDLAARHFGRQRPRPVVPPDDVLDRLLVSASTAPELWHQKSYLARALSRDPDGLVHDEGIVSLAEFVDAAGPDGVAITVETDDRGDIHPAVYVRRRGRVDADARLSSDPLLDFSGASSVLRRMGSTSGICSRQPDDARRARMAPG